LKELEKEVEPNRIVYGMSLGLYVPEDESEDEPAGLTRTVKAGSKVRRLWLKMVSIEK
jgi:hypothetical protein